MDKNTASNNYENGVKVNDTDIVTYASKTIIVMDEVYYMGQAITVRVNVVSDKSLNGFVRVRIASYSETLPVEGNSTTFYLHTADFSCSTYIIYAEYFNDTHCAPSEDSKIFTIYPSTTISSANLTRVYNSKYDYRAAFYDFRGNPVVNRYVEFIVDGVSYHVLTDANGIAYLESALYLGMHSVVIKNPITNQTNTNTVKIIKRMYVKNVNTYYNSGYYAKAKVYTSNGKLAVNVKVSVTFNGKTYTVVTDSNGYAKFKVGSKNIKAKKYTITFSYMSAVEVRNVVVKHLLTAKSPVKVSKNKGGTVKILLKGKKVLKNKKVSVKFAGKTLKVKTNSKGYVNLKISKNTLSTLKKGKTYNLKATYLKDSITVKVKIR